MMLRRINLGSRWTAVVDSSPCTSAKKHVDTRVAATRMHRIRRPVTKCWGTSHWFYSRVNRNDICNTFVTK
jgi:hypothetical protein